MTADKDEGPIRPRGRPVLPASERVQSRARVAQAAQALFESEGYGEVSMRRLAAALGCSPMTLYKLYPGGKIDILRHIWDVILGRLQHRLESLDAQDGPSRLHLEARALAFVDYWLEHPDHYRVVFMAEGVTQPEVSLFLEGAPVQDRLGVLLDSLALATGLQIGTPAFSLAADCLLAALLGIVHTRITISGHDWSPPEAMVAMTISGLLLRARGAVP